MKQRNGAELFGANDPRSASIGIIEVAPEDDRQSLLTALLTQDKLHRKQTVIILPEQSKALRSASDFKDFESALTGLHTQLVFVTPRNSPLARAARQRNYAVFASLENYAQYARTFLNETLTTPPDDTAQPSSAGTKSTPKPTKNTGKNKDKTPTPVQPQPPSPQAPEDEPTRPLAGPAVPPTPAAAPPAPPTPQHREEAQAAGTDTRDRQKQKKGGVEPTPIILGEPLEDEAPPAQPAPAAVPQPQPSASIENDPKKKTTPDPVPAAQATRPPGPSVQQPPATPIVDTTPARPLPVPTTPPAKLPAPAQSPARAERRPQRSVRWPVLLAILLLIILIGGISFSIGMGYIPLTRIFPGLASATITITPDSKPFPHSYTLTAINTLDDLQTNQVHLRFLTAALGMQTKTVPASGKGNRQATYAHGALTFYNRLATEQTIPAGTVITADSGVQVITEEEARIPAATVSDGINERFATVQARALLPGSKGNIAPFTFTRATSFCCRPGIAVENSGPFMGGDEARTYSYVQQSDIDQAAATLIGPLQQQKKSELQANIAPNERLIGPIQCTTSTLSDLEAGEQAEQVHVTVEVTCSGAVYNQQEVQTQVSKLLKEDGEKKFTADYAPAGDIHVEITNVKTTNQPDQATLEARASEHWIYQFSPSKRDNILRQVAGKNRQEAQQQLERTEGVKQATIDLPWYAGGNMPTNVQQIKLVVQPS